MRYQNWSVFLNWKVTKYIYSNTVKVQIQGALLENFHFMELYTSAPLRGKYFTVYSTTLTAWVTSYFSDNLPAQPLIS